MISNLIKKLSRVPQNALFHNMRNGTKNGTLLENTALEIQGQNISHQWILEICIDEVFS